MTEKLRLALTGVSGRMGSALARLLEASDDLMLVAATERAGSPWLGKSIGAAVVRGDLGQALAGNRVDAVIDFTSAEASLAHADVCASAGVPLVIGSTGFTPEARASLSTPAACVPLVWAPNMSVGVNLILEVAAHLAQVLGPSYDCEVVEVHHRLKKDAPSGTALALAESIAQATGRGHDNFTTARSGQVGARPAGEIGLSAVRGGDVVGEHTVYFLGEGERVELTHRATNRDTFATGALRAARWIVGKPPGLYGMKDVLGLKA